MQPRGRGKSEKQTQVLSTFKRQLEEEGWVSTTEQRQSEWDQENFEALLSEQVKQAPELRGESSAITGKGHLYHTQGLKCRRPD